MARPKVNTEYLKIRITPKQLEKLRKMAEIKGLSMSEMIRTLVDAA